MCTRPAEGRRGVMRGGGESRYGGCKGAAIDRAAVGAAMGLQLGAFARSTCCSCASARTAAMPTPLSAASSSAGSQEGSTVHGPRCASRPAPVSLSLSCTIKLRRPTGGLASRLPASSPPPSAPPAALSRICARSACCRLACCCAEVRVVASALKCGSSTEPTRKEMERVQSSVPAWGHAPAG